MQRVDARLSAPTRSARVLLTCPVKVCRPQVVRCTAAASNYATLTTLPASLQKIVTAFQMVPDPMARYKQLLYYAAKLGPLPESDHIPSNKVEGCVSQVWVKPELRDDGCVYWQADSDSQLTKGLAALLVTGLNGCTPPEILGLKPEGFIEALGLKQSLTPSRNNGFLNMFKLMQRKTLALAAATVADAAPSGDAAMAAASVVEPAAAAESPAEASASDIEADVARAAAPRAGPSGRDSGRDGHQAAPEAAAHAPPAGGGAPLSKTPLQDSMRSKLTAALTPDRMVIEDQSSQHAGHSAMRVLSAGKAGAPSETHFRLEVVSSAFEGLSLVKRHRLIYQVLSEELAGGLHALSLDTKAPSEARS